VLLCAPCICENRVSRNAEPKHKRKTQKEPSSICVPVETEMPMLFRVLAQHGDRVVGDLHEAAADVEVLFGAAGFDGHVARAEQNQHGRVALHDAELAIPGGDDDRIGAVLEDGALRAHDGREEAVRGGESNWRNHLT
jgi:hypothetical protein